MKLVHPNLEIQIDFEKNDIYCLTIENAKEFFSFTHQLFLQTLGDDGDFVLSDNEILNISKNCAFIYDYYSDILNSKKTMSIAANDVTEILKKDDFVEDFSNLNTIMLKINDKIAEQLSYNVNYIDEIDYATFVKLSSFKIENTNSLVENLLSYIQIIDKKILIFINLFNFLSYNDLNLLLKQLRYMEKYCIFINSHQKYKICDSINFIIDEDLCVI